MENDWFEWINDINFDLVTRAGITWNNSKYYIGASLVIKYSMTIANLILDDKLFRKLTYIRRIQFLEKKRIQTGKVIKKLHPK